MWEKEKKGILTQTCGLCSVISFSTDMYMQQMNKTNDLRKTAKNTIGKYVNSELENRITPFLSLLEEFTYEHHLV